MTAPKVKKNLTTNTPPTTASTGPLVQIEGVTKDFGTDRILDGIDLTVAPREIVALVGRSGSGKSTLLRLVAGLDQDYAGGLQVAGQVAIAFQEPRLLPWKPVHRNVSLNLPGKRRERDRAALQALEEVGLAHRVNAWPTTLSGGEAQRVSLARALVRQPDLLLLDEPFGALDALTRLSAHAYLVRLWRNHGFGALLVTHDVDEALALADRVIVLADGRISRDLTVPTPRLANRTDPATLELRTEVLAALGVRTEGQLGD